MSRLENLSYPSSPTGKLSYIRLGCGTKGCKGMKQASALAKARKQCNANKQMTHKRRKRRKSYSLDSNEHTVSQPGAETSNSCWRANDASSAINTNPRKAWRVRIGNSCHFYY